MVVFEKNLTVSKIDEGGKFVVGGMSINDIIS